ncbi:MAG: transglutaminase-like domain-containing protein, partial [Pseudomonadota bacterium]
EEGYQITENVFLDMTIMNVPQRLETRINSVTDRDLALRVFSFRLKSGVISFAAYGNVNGKTLKLNIDTAGKNQKQTLQLQEAPVLSNSLKYAVLKHGLKPGITFAQNFFDPMTLGNRTIQVEVEAEDVISIHDKKISCFRIKQTFNGIMLYSWVSAGGDTLKEESPMGLMLIKEEKEQAMHEGWSEKPDILSATAIKVDNAFSKEGLTYLKVRLKNIPLDGFTLNSGRQLQQNESLEIRLENKGAVDSFAVPFAGSGFEEFLRPTVFIQSDSPQLKTLAGFLLQEEKDAGKITEKLMHWVYRNIEKKPTLSIPNALEVLTTKQGDCNEHAVLLVALCRAAGVPAKMCAGIVYVNGSFYYHAWVEVYIGSWVSVDPTMDQFPADVTHIKFVEGDMESQISILKLIGKLEVEVEEYR